MAPTQTSSSQPKLLIYTCVVSAPLQASITQALAGERFEVVELDATDQIIDIIEQKKHNIDCLLLEQTLNLAELLLQLLQRATLLPAIVVGTAGDETEGLSPECNYHTAEVWAQASQLPPLPQLITQAITKFLQLSPACRLPNLNFDGQGFDLDAWLENLNLQQGRLSDKLRERLGYLGVYYKRHPQQFLRNLPDTEQQELLQSLKIDYQQILLDYFHKDQKVNQDVDTFVTQVFFADMPVSQVLEIHMELMDAFSKRLKLEGRNEDILLDYRLVLIDTVAHLCEMYRRSIPRNE